LIKSLKEKKEIVACWGKRGERERKRKLRESKKKMKNRFPPNLKGTSKRELETRTAVHFVNKTISGNKTDYFGGRKVRFTEGGKKISKPTFIRGEQQGSWWGRRRPWQIWVVGWEVKKRVLTGIKPGWSQALGGRMRWMLVSRYRFFCRMKLKREARGVERAHIQRKRGHIEERGSNTLLKNNTNGDRPGAMTKLKGEDIWRAGLVDTSIRDGREKKTNKLTSNPTATATSASDVDKYYSWAQTPI